MLKVVVILKKPLQFDEKKGNKVPENIIGDKN